MSQGHYQQNRNVINSANIEISKFAKSMFSLSSKQEDILKILFKFGWLEIQQINDLLGNKHLSSTYRVIQLMNEKKLIIFKKIKLNGKICNLSAKALNLMYEFLPNNHTKTSQRQSAVPTKQKSFILNCIKFCKFDWRNCITDIEITRTRSKQNDQSKIPDLMLLYHGSLIIKGQTITYDENTAFEFETSLKDKDRYKIIFNKYHNHLMNKELNKVIYVCDSKKIYNFFMNFKEENIVHSKIDFVYLSFN